MDTPGLFAVTFSGQDGDVLVGVAPNDKAILAKLFLHHALSVIRRETEERIHAKLWKLTNSELEVQANLEPEAAAKKLGEMTTMAELDAKLDAWREANGHRYKLERIA